MIWALTSFALLLCIYSLRSLGKSMGIKEAALRRRSEAQASEKEAKRLLKDAKRLLKDARDERMLTQYLK